MVEEMRDLESISPDFVYACGGGEGGQSQRRETNYTVAVIRRVAGAKAARGSITMLARDFGLPRAARSLTRHATLGMRVCANI
eukprot:SAG11_NODE_2579_length_3199_cov_13.264194_4_plen_83_part_00